MADVPAPSTPVSSWRCCWCRAQAGTIVLDLGDQPAADDFPAANAPTPDRTFGLRMVMCAACHLAQIEDDPTSAQEPRGVEPEALVRQGLDAVGHLADAGIARPGGRVLEFASPHGGSWLGPLAERGLHPVGGGPADLVVDSFGMMHDADQRAALAARAACLAEGGALALHYHSLATILRTGAWNALRHGHVAYYSTPALVAMARELGLVAVAAREYPLYGGTVMLVLAAAGASGAREHPDVTALVAKEIADGVTDPRRVATLGSDLLESVAAIRAYLRGVSRAGLTVAGYGAASRTAALLQCAGVGRQDLSAVADASSAKQGRMLPVSRVPIVGPTELVALRPDRVLLFVPDLLPEVRAALPEIEASGGRWVVLDPMPREVQPVT
ncbi:transferase [Pengzhenrongella frigida]|uniref:Transferase n=1 Tax=Pengzhenrongella frigida TaxID=1259133 RepID=A0A4Q5MYJ3_9MICO|nr:transferase [Cellulomonas sp. HLT2-17]RYV50760.1 transferase [Cellulomonas sp. HLT2-17]